MKNDPYSTVREILGWAVGRTIIDISQHDREDFDPVAAADGLSGGAFVRLMLDNGATLTFPIADEGFHHEQPDDHET